MSESCDLRTHSPTHPLTYSTTAGLEWPTDLLWRTQCGGGFKQCIGSYDPDMVVSLHPLCQNLPLKVSSTSKVKRALVK